jgi:hypothetical protein
MLFIARRYFGVLIDCSAVGNCLQSGMKLRLISKSQQVSERKKKDYEKRALKGNEEENVCGCRTECKVFVVMK